MLSKRNLRYLVYYTLYIPNILPIYYVKRTIDTFIIDGLNLTSVFYRAE